MGRSSDLHTAEPGRDGARVIEAIINDVTDTFLPLPLPLPLRNSGRVSSVIRMVP